MTSHRTALDAVGSFWPADRPDRRLPGRTAGQTEREPPRPTLAHFHRPRGGESRRLAAQRTSTRRRTNAQARDVGAAILSLVGRGGSRGAVPASEGSRAAVPPEADTEVKGCRRTHPLRRRPRAAATNRRPRRSDARRPPPARIGAAGDRRLREEEPATRNQTEATTRLKTGEHRPRDTGTEPRAVDAGTRLQKRRLHRARGGGDRGRRTDHAAGEQEPAAVHCGMGHQGYRPLRLSDVLARLKSP